MPERVIVIDPGERTGWVRCVIGDDGSLSDIVQGVHTIRDFALALHEAALGKKFDTIVFETWRLRADKAHVMVGNEFLPSQLIGMIRLCGWISGAKLKSLAPASKKTGRAHMPDVLRKRLKRSSEEHDKDALDLLSVYLYRTYGGQNA